MEVNFGHFEYSLGRILTGENGCFCSSTCFRMMLEGSNHRKPDRGERRISFWIGRRSKFLKSEIFRFLIPQAGSVSKLILEVNVDGGTW